MVSIGPVSPTATALRLISAARDSGRTSLPLGLEPASAARLSPAVSDAVLMIQSLLGGRAEGPGAGLAAKIAQQDAWYRTVDMVSVDDFEQGVKEILAEHAKLNPRLKAAMQTGTVRIQRAEEVEGLNYRLHMEFQYGDYGFKQGVENMSSTFDQRFYQQELAAGKSVIMGWQGGGVGSFYVTF